MHEVYTRMDSYAIPKWIGTCAYLCAHVYLTMDIANRLDQAMKFAEITTQSALSRSSGVPQPTINRILKGVVGKRGPETQTLTNLARACNVNVDWLREGRGPMSRAASREAGDFFQVVAAEGGDPDFYEIPKVELRLSAGLTGFQSVPEIYDGRKLSVPRNWADRHGYSPDKLLALTVKGESMEPGLGSGDLVVINTADTVLTDGAVYAVNYEGEAVIKRLSRDRGEWWLTSDNPDQHRFHRKACRHGECILIGRVVRKESDRI